MRVPLPGGPTTPAPPRVLPALGVPIGLAPWLSVLFLMHVFSSIFGCDDPAALQTQVKWNMRFVPWTLLTCIREQKEFFMKNKGKQAAVLEILHQFPSKLGDQVPIFVNGRKEKVFLYPPCPCPTSYNPPVDSLTVGSGNNTASFQV
ncbi:hypothetical protein E5288_WYG014457 [Bos mutus]|uniref:Uncharacterized protein n=1 Tax=Bos mutus TaxID=72004 RepID=A0A6B0R7H8_9CETA|nr:hypothetical protein [Bos mutus]